MSRVETIQFIFQSVLDQLPDAVQIVDRNFDVLYLNAVAGKRTGQGIEEQIGKKCYEVLYGRSKPCAFCPASMTFETGESRVYLQRTVQGVASERSFEELLCLPLKTDEADVHWVVEIVRDVTKEKELESQLIKRERLVSFGELATSIAHEFNNPLGIIQGFAQDLLSEVEPSDPRHQPLKIIEEEVGRCKRIMQDLLEYAQPTHAHLALTDLKSVVQKGMDLVAAQFHQSKAKAAIEIEADLPPIYADAQQLEQVLLNLFFNAMDAMPDGGILTVRVLAQKTHSVDGPPRQEVVIAVTDTGRGIDANDLPEIFRPFFTTKKKKGMGLGLSICERILKAHGGRIEVDSVPGRGTTFYLYLPVERRKHARYQDNGNGSP